MDIVDHSEIDTRNTLRIRTQEKLGETYMPGYNIFEDAQDFARWMESQPSSDWLGVDVACGLYSLGINFSSNEYLAKQIGRDKSGIIIALDPRLTHRNLSQSGQSIGNAHWVEEFNRGRDKKVTVCVVPAKSDDPTVSSALTGKIDQALLVSPDPRDLEYITEDTYKMLKAGGNIQLLIDPTNASDAIDPRKMDTKLLADIYEKTQGATVFEVNKEPWSPSETAVTDFTVLDYYNRGYPQSTAISKTEDWHKQMMVVDIKK